MLDQDVVFRADEFAVQKGAQREVRGAPTVAKFFSGRAQAARSALIDGAVGVVVAPRGRLLVVLGVTIRDGKIVAIDAMADPARLSELDLAVMD